MIQVCNLSFANSSITDTLGNYSLASSGNVTISGINYPTNTDPILYVTDSSYSCIEFGQTATYSNGAIIQAGVPTYGSENWSVEFRARVTVAMPEYSANSVIFYGCRAPYDDNGTLRMGGHWSISINHYINALEFGYVDHYDILTIKDNLDFTSWHLYKVTKTAEEILTLHIDGVLVATIDLEQQIGYKTHATLGSFVLLGDADWSPTTNRIHTDQAVRLADVKVYADPMGHAEKAISLDNLSRVFRNYNTWLGAQLSGQIGDGTLTIQQNGTNVATFTANQSTAATANITVPTAVSELANDSGYLTASSNLDASKLTSGTVDIARLPQGALERLVKVANEAARYALTTADVQLGDTVQQLDTGIMYVVTDTDHLDSAAGYTEYTAGTAASVPWSGVTGKPTFAAVATSGAYSDLTGTPALAAVATSGAYSDLTGTPTIPTVNNATLTIQRNGTNVQTFTANQSTNATANIEVPTKTSDLTNDSNFVQSSDLATVATSGSYNDLSNKPAIPTVNNATLTIQQNGTTVDTFTANASSNVTANITVPTKTSDLTNDSGFITEDNTKIPLAGSNQISGSLIPSTDGTVNLGGPSYQWNNAYIKSLTINGVVCGNILTHNVSEFVPRTGGAVMTGTELYKTTNTEGLNFGGGTAWDKGGSITMYGAQHSSSAGTIKLQPALNSATFKGMFLKPDGTWTWSGTAVQLVSDQRLKQQIAEIDDKLLDAWQDVDLVQFKYNDAVEQKGDKARLHTGFVVQQIDKACKEHGVNISAYGLYCHEEYPQEVEEVEVEQADGTKTKERKVIREASEHYSLRYTEALVVECKYLRRCIARLTARIEELERSK